MENPLWLPKGSVRSILALLTVIAAIVLMIIQSNVPEWFIAIVGSVITHYFVSRKQE